MLSKEQKERLTGELTGLFSVVKLRLDGHEITINRVRIAENKTALGVYIDGEIKGEDIGPLTDETRAICRKVWRHRQRSLYKPGSVAKLVKEVGKRRARKIAPDLDKKITLIDPTFNTAGSLVRQFSRLEGLEVVAIGVEQEA
ncbi:hypothetical protein GCM10023116_31030 [Kistimonas scapharcae]|uniref:Uncharacterized protein n=1 Tax=Kistimonas scapharcae TaxID=1036133 RepID=A0ABP8V408_9GAMM